MNMWILCNKSKVPIEVKKLRGGKKQWQQQLGKIKWVSEWGEWMSERANYIHFVH
jgi:hypothetical protein